MKNIFLFVFFFGIITSSYSYCQSKTSLSKWKLGVKIAQNDYLHNDISLSTISHVISHQLKTFYFTLGGIAEYRFNNYFSLVTGLEYSNRNYKRSDNGPSGFETHKSNLLQLPVSLRIYPIHKKAGIFIQAGLNNTYDVTNNIRYYNYSGNLTASLGYDFKISNEYHLSFYTQYESSNYYHSNYFRNKLLNLNIAFQKAF